MNRVHFPCVTQKLKIHDGEFLSSNLLAQFTSTDVVSYKNFSVMSSGPIVLLEYSISENLNNFDCAGGFLCHFRQKGKKKTNYAKSHNPCTGPYELLGANLFNFLPGNFISGFLIFSQSS